MLIKCRDVLCGADRSADADADRALMLLLIEVGGALARAAGYAVAWR